MVPVQKQQQQSQQHQRQPVCERKIIWQGVLEWREKTDNPYDPRTLTRHVQCQVSTNSKEGEPDLIAESWPQKLIMLLMPEQLIAKAIEFYLHSSKSVLFHPQNCEALESLTKVMSSGFGGCVYFTSMSPTSACDKLLIVVYTPEKHAYLGFLSNDQTIVVDHLQRIIPLSNSSQALIRQGQEMVPVQQQQQQQSQQQKQKPVCECKIIWQGMLKWTEKTGNPYDPHKITRRLQCQVSTYVKEGEPDLKADSWPQKLILKLIPKWLLQALGPSYLQDSKAVLFHPQICEALESLTKVMSSGLAGCLHLPNMSPTSACDIKVLILLYIPKKCAYLGFIHNEPTIFLNRLLRVIKNKKPMLTLRRQGQPAPMSAPGDAQQPPGTTQGQPQAPAIMLSQTNTVAMGGGQVVSSSASVPTSQAAVQLNRITSRAAGAVLAQLEQMSLQEDNPSVNHHLQQEEQQEQLLARLEQMSLQEQRQMTPQVLQQQRMTQLSGIVDNPGVNHHLQQHHPQYWQSQGQMQQQQQQQLAGPLGVQSSMQQPGPVGQPQQQQQQPYNDVAGSDMFG